MGIRKSHGKNKKSKRPAAAVAVKRDEALRKVAKHRATRRAAAEGPAGGSRADRGG